MNRKRSYCRGKGIVIWSAYHETLSYNDILFLILRFRHLEVIESA